MKAKKITSLLFLAGMLFTGFCQAQVSHAVTAGMGYNLKNMITFDAGYVTRQGYYFFGDFGVSARKGTEGAFNTLISWDMFPGDLVKEGSYYTMAGVGAGKVFRKVYVAGLMGIRSETPYRNCYDQLHILGIDGRYYKTGDARVIFNAGFEAGLIAPWFKMGIQYSIRGGAGLKAGCALPLR